MSSEIEIKTERLQKMLARETSGGVLINAQHNFAWLTGGKSNGINLSSENGTCFLLIRGDGKRFILANNIEMPRLLSEEISAADFEPVEFSWQDEKASGNFIFEKAKSLVPPNAELVSDLLLSPQVRSIENLIARCRYELTDAEIERYRRLGKEAGAAIGNLFENLKPGETETEIARRVRDALAAYNISPIVALVGADARIENFRHPVPTLNVWKKVLLIAVCAKREGLIANLTRIACVGKIPGELERKTAATAYVFARLLSETGTGASGAKLYKSAAAAYAEKGFADEINRHHQGGATGYKTRDWVAHPANSEIVFKNQAFAWNPSIAGTKTEETCLVFSDRIETITQSANFPRAAIEIGGREYLSPGILSL
ncbi:MAG TPA: M24 family metallopeptidase [Pyrinomonadaceae bacterium]